MAPVAEWSEEHIRRRVGELGEWFQNMELGGVHTAPNHFLGDYPGHKWREISAALPARLDGLTVLDIGCNAGFHAQACKRRGARHVLGIDADRTYLEQARFAAQVEGLEIEWRHMSVYQLEQIAGQFDYVFFLGVFYHLRYPLYALDLVVKKVRQRLVFQTMLRGEESSLDPERDYDFWDQAPFGEAGFPRMHFIEHSYAGDSTNWWIPNRAAAEAMLRSAGLELAAHPEAETWICTPRREIRSRGAVVDLELAGTL